MKLPQWVVLLNIEVDIEKPKEKLWSDMKANYFLNLQAKYDFGYTLTIK